MKDLQMTNLLSLAETARILGVHHDTVRHWIAKGDLRAVRIGGRMRVPYAEIHRLVTTENGNREQCPCEGGTGIGSETHSSCTMEVS
jgi:excisionase family DNA binding protein